MALKPPGKNAPIDEETRQKLFALGNVVDVATTYPRFKDITDGVRPYTLEEMTRLIDGRISSVLQVFELPWDERLTSELADRAMSASPPLAVVLLAGSGRYDEARALYARLDPALRRQSWSGGVHVELAAGDFGVPDHPTFRVQKLNTISSIVRFRPIADRIADAADDLIAKLPLFFFESTYPEKFSEIWSPALRSFALLTEDDEKAADDHAALLAELSAVKATGKHGLADVHKKQALVTMLRLAIHTKRLVSAYRIAGKLGKIQYPLAVAVEYAKAGDLGGVWEIVKKMELTKGAHFDHLAQALRETAS